MRRIDSYTKFDYVREIFKVDLKAGKSIKHERDIAKLYIGMATGNTNATADTILNIGMYHIYAQ